MEPTTETPVATETTAEKVSPIREDLRASQLAPDEIEEFKQLNDAVVKIQAELGLTYCGKLELDAEYQEKAAQYDAQIGKLKQQLDGNTRVIESAKLRLTRKYGLTPTSKVDLATGDITY